jgi:hypothetical protein
MNIKFPLLLLLAAPPLSMPNPILVNGHNTEALFLRSRFVISEAFAVDRREVWSVGRIEENAAEFNSQYTH